MQAIGIIRNYVTQMRRVSMRRLSAPNLITASPEILLAGIFGHDEMKGRYKK